MEDILEKAREFICFRPLGESERLQTEGNPPQVKPLIVVNVALPILSGNQRSSRPLFDLSAAWALASTFDIPN